MKVMIIGQGISGQAVANYLDRNNIENFFAKDEDINASIICDKYADKLLKAKINASYTFFVLLHFFAA